jgi:hypothetical protein
MLFGDVKTGLFTRVETAGVTTAAVERIAAQAKPGALALLLLSGRLRRAADCGDGMPLSFDGNGMTAAPRLVAVMGLICGEPDEDRARNVGDDRESEEEEGEKEDWVVVVAAGPLETADLTATMVAGLRMVIPDDDNGDDLAIPRDAAAVAAAAELLEAAVKERLLAGSAGAGEPFTLP